MVKVVIIGAGSHVFSRNLITDILSYPELRDSIISLMDINRGRFDLIESYACRLIDQEGFNTKLESTTDRRTALEEADYVIVSIRVGGFEARKVDLEIPAKYGIVQAVGDTIGPGGVFYGLRHVPVLLGVCRDMEELCPNALLINYTNPMSILCWAMNHHTSIKNVGLCHSVQGTASELARYIGAPKNEISYWVAGINHMAWFLEFKWRGEDAYPLLRESLSNPAVYSHPDAHWAGPDNVRVKIFETFGYFNTESSQHMSEYVPYFRQKPESFEEYMLESAFLHDKRAIARREEQDDELKRILKDGDKLPIRRTDEYCATIIHSMETGTPSRINGNVKNQGLITNLPSGSCVEVPCLVDRNGIHPIYVGDLPPQCAALNRTNINVHELAVKGAIKKNKTMIHQAILLDPLTSAMLTIDETHTMVEELFESHEGYLKGYKQ